MRTSTQRITAIPTLYKGTEFRSRLEARWAAFFDQVSWPWTYEPLDFAGYVPDFTLNFYKPLLVEVKPATALSELLPHRQKIETSGWGESLLLGCSPSIALLDEIWEGHNWGEVTWFLCGGCKCPSICHADMTFACRKYGCYEGDHYLGDLPDGFLNEAWNRAHYQTKWGSGLL